MDNRIHNTRPATWEKPTLTTITAIETSENVLEYQSGTPPWQTNEYREEQR
jgi:hypothetical protein